MKQALNRLALYCAARGLAICVSSDGFAVTPGGSGRGGFAQPIEVDELADRIEAMNSAPMPTRLDFDVPGYETLAEVLQLAFNQAARGKGKERHAKDQPFHEQVMQVGAQHFGTGSLLFQAFKKAEESQRLPHDRAEAELLGAIVYLAGAVIAERRKRADRNVAANDPSAKAAGNA
jgi:hypothetical protein